MSITLLRRQMRNGAYNFYWIAGLSFANSIYFVFITRSNFVIGLGLTQFMDTLTHNVAQSYPNSIYLIQLIGLVPDFFVCSVFFLCGILAVKGYRWVFIGGMALYGLDAILTLVSLDFIGFGFHLFFFWFLYSGLRALDKLTKIKGENTSTSVSPKNLGI